MEIVTHERSHGTAQIPSLGCGGSPSVPPMRLVDYSLVHQSAEHDGKEMDVDATARFWGQEP